MKQLRLSLEPTREVDELPPLPALPEELMKQLLDVMATAILAVNVADEEERENEPTA